jgi:hypothetical protein
LYLEGSVRSTALAGVLITLKDLLDAADGQLARAKGMFSRAGRFLDSIGDLLVNLLVFSAIAYVLTTTNGNVVYGILAAFGFIGMTLRVSYHVYYQTSFLHLRDTYSTNRVTEEIREEDLQEDRLTLGLHKVFQALYGWQDRLMMRIDQWCRQGVPAADWFSDWLGLRLSGFLGFGSELFLLTLCSLLNQLEAYLFLNIFLMNGILLSSILYRRYILSRRPTH